ncbi:MAG: rod shape-determining protein MreC [Thermoleophilaceae bacterium]|nr:rod shape-determining protein MreC [Thermoleophilaceae bacterium]
MYDRKVVRRRRAVLATFVGLSLALLTVYFGESAGGALHAIQRGAQAVFSPVEAGVSKVLKPFRDIAGWTGDVLHAQGENKTLRKELAELRLQASQGQLAQRDAAELRGLLGLPRSDGFPVTRRVTARITARSPQVWYSTVQIDKGRSDGIRVNQPVLAANGLAGKITQVGGGSAQVTLITDGSSNVSAMVVPDGASGIVRPEVGNPNDLLLDYIQKGRDIKRGETVVTSGFASSKLESLFPRGIPIGRVTRVEPGELDLYRRVHITPFADLRRMNYVQVIVGVDRSASQTAAGGTGS